MPSPNETFVSQLDQLGLRVPEILLPNSNIDLGAWAVVACDQYTSDHEYWASVETKVGTAASTLRLVLPEIFLGQPDVPARVERIHAQMGDYLERQVLESKGECAVYVRRTTARSGLREGLVLAVDLERYNYSPGSKSLIRATEGTIVDRIPPRLAVRRQAPLELPHIMVLVEDEEQCLIEGLGARLGQLERLYDVDLMQEGGRLEGYRLDQSDLEHLLNRLVAAWQKAKLRQNSETPLFWAMGDGNHSLATAKANWEEVKRGLNETGRDSEAARHPARWALVEIVNVYSSGLRFEPIHRVVFTSHVAELATLLRGGPLVPSIAPIAESDLVALLASPDGQDKVGYFDGSTFQVVHWSGSNSLPPALVDGLYQRFSETDQTAKIDFIHGWQDAKKLAQSGACAFFLPVLGRDRLFAHVAEHGPLPRKAFSMGDAEEKRYYMEARRITP